jgi:GNAT superfamily N-acetyltransferase
MIKICEVKSKREFRRFIQFPNILYRDDQYYIPELYVSQKTMFNRKKNPFFSHSKVDFFLAYKANCVAGRIALIRNNNHISHTGEKCGFFGFFESIDDLDVAKALFDKAMNWLGNEGLTSIIGPENFTTNNSCGTLISGFDSPPVVMMPYNKAWYNDFLEQYGFVKEMDLFSYSLISDHILTFPNLGNLLKRISYNLAASGITIKPINYKALDREIIPLLALYNLSNKDNWGFLPLTEQEFRETAYQLRQFVPEKLILIVEKEKRPIGFIMAIPDLNQVLSHIKAGKLWPFGILKFLWYKGKIKNARILILGVLEEFRNKGIDILLYRKIQDNIASMGIDHAEACYVLENNLQMRSIIEKIGGKCVKRYRIYKFDKLTHDGQDHVESLR